jgi:hypothetical protein
MLTLSETSEMIIRLGFFMGLDFRPGIVSYINGRFGGHPFFIRQLCSHIHKRVHAKDDYAVMDGDRSVGRIYKDATAPRWIWSVNTSPFPAPPPNNGLAKSLEEAKHQFKERYEEMKAQGVRPFA